MCVLVVAWRVCGDAPLVVAANRDEAYERAASLPEPGLAHGSRALFPRDLRAGGTWEGTSASGLVVVITNRPDGDFDATRRSRGLLCTWALGQPDTRAVRRDLEPELRRARYNSFNLFYADRRAAFVSSWNGELHTVELQPGLHVLSNEYALGQLEISELGGLPRESGQVLRKALAALLASHAIRDGAGFRICKHGERYGTVSGSLIYREPDGTGVIEHAPGPPCRTPFSVHRLG